MDGYYQSQLSMPYYSGVSRQRGSGLGAFALSVGRAALPVFRNIIWPTARKFGKNVISELGPELVDVMSGKESFKSATKGAVKRSLKSQLGSGKKKKRKVTKKSPKKRSKSRKTNTRRKIDVLGNLRS